jgi:hypothetical protein
MSSAREQIAERIAAFIRSNSLNSPFGGDVVLSRRGKIPCYLVDFAKPRVLDGSIRVFGPKFIQIKYMTAYRALPHKDGVVFDSEENAIAFIKAAFVDLDFDKAESIPRKS